MYSQQQNQKYEVNYSLWQFRQFVTNVRSIYVKFYILKRLSNCKISAIFAITTTCRKFLNKSLPETALSNLYVPRLQ